MKTSNPTLGQIGVPTLHTASCCRCCPPSNPTLGQIGVPTSTNLGIPDEMERFQSHTRANRRSDVMLLWSSICSLKPSNPTLGQIGVPTKACRMDQSRSCSSNPTLGQIGVPTFDRIGGVRARIRFQSHTRANRRSDANTSLAHSSGVPFQSHTRANRRSDLLHSALTLFIAPPSNPTLGQIGVPTLSGCRAARIAGASNPTLGQIGVPTFQIVLLRCKKPFLPIPHSGKSAFRLSRYIPTLRLMVHFQSHTRANRRSDRSEPDSPVRDTYPSNPTLGQIGVPTGTVNLSNTWLHLFQSHTRANRRSDMWCTCPVASPAFFQSHTRANRRSDAVAIV